MYSIREPLFTAVEKANLDEIKRIFENNPITIIHFFEQYNGVNLMGYASVLATKGEAQQNIFIWLKEQFEHYKTCELPPVALDGIDYPFSEDSIWKNQLELLLNGGGYTTADLIDVLPLHLNLAAHLNNWAMVLHIYEWLKIGFIYTDCNQDAILHDNSIQKTIRDLIENILHSRKLDGSEQDTLLLRCLSCYTNLIQNPDTEILPIAKKYRDYEIVSLALNMMKGTIPITLAGDDWHIVRLICQLTQPGSHVNLVDFDKTLKKAIECFQQNKKDRELLLSCIKLLHALHARTERIPESAGNTILHLACLNSDRDLIPLLLPLDIYMSCSKNKAGKLPLEIVADTGDFQTLRIMCSHIDNRYGDIRSTVRGTALHKVVEALNPQSDNGLLFEIIKDLLQCEILINPVTIATAKTKGFPLLADKLLQVGQNYYKPTAQLPTKATEPPQQRTETRNQFFPPLRKNRPQMPLPAPAVNTHNPLDWESKKNRLVQFITQEKAACTKDNPGPKESQDLVTQLNQVVENVKDKRTATKTITRLLRAFFHVQFSVGNFTETPTITRLKACNIITIKTLDKFQKNYIALNNLFNDFSKLTFSTPASHTLINDLKTIRDKLYTIPLNEQYKAIRARCHEYFLERQASGNTEKTEFVLLLEQHIGITDEAVQEIEARKLMNEFFLITPAAPK